MKKKETTAPAPGKERLRRLMERTATFGLLLVAVGIVGPFALLDNQMWMTVFKWIFGAGALVFTAARVVNVSDPGDSLRVRRLRRMEMWAGFAFCIAAFFWFFNVHRWGGVYTLKVLNDTIMFTMAGALIQIIASWMLSSALRKQEKERAEKK